MAPIEEMPDEDVDDGTRIYISTLDRSFQTARKLYGTREFCKTDLINEVPLRSAFDTKCVFPIWFWNISGRIQWLFNSKRQPESRRQTVERAVRFSQGIMARNEDCVLVTHGFFMHILISVLKSSGFLASKRNTHYKNGEKVIMTRQE